VLVVDRKDLKICFLAGTLGRGGAERQLVYMLRALKAAGIETRLLCLTKDEPLEEEIRAMGIRTTWVGASRWRPVRLYRVIKELRREPAHIFQSAHFYTNLYVAVAARLLGIKSIGAVRNDLTSELKGHGFMGWGQLHLTGQLITNSELARRRAIDEGIKPEHIEVVPNVVDVNGANEQVNGNGAGAARILFAARLTDQKRPDRFLRALQKIAESRPDLDFRGIIVGDGPLRPGLEELADSLGLRPKYLEFQGELGDLKPAYEKSDLVVLTSDWEGTPNVLLEAMSRGLPIVATNVGGVSELVRNGENGLLVGKDDGDSVARSVIALIEDPQLRISMGASGRQVAREKHSPRRLAERLMAVYEKALWENGSSPNPARSTGKPGERQNYQRRNDPGAGSGVELL
jgi:glycosyltransferase involved in cell wall biosynthesis